MSVQASGNGVLPFISGVGEARAPRLRPSWPPTLPSLFLRDSWSEEGGDGAVRTDLDDVILTTREVSSAAPDEFNFSIRLSDDQLQPFRDFYVHTTAFGAISFNHALPGTSTIVRMKFREPPVVQSVSNGDSSNFVAQGRMEVLVA